MKLTMFLFSVLIGGGSLFANGTEGQEKREFPEVALEETKTGFLDTTLPRYESTQVFASASMIAPGAGVSLRSRSGSTGVAVDWKLGVMKNPFFDSESFMGVFSVDANYLYFFNKTKRTSLYGSCGIGTANIIVPYIPLRLGVEYRYGFFDLGGKLLLGYIPSPEARVGFNVKF